MSKSMSKSKSNSIMKVVEIVCEKYDIEVEECKKYVEERVKVKENVNVNVKIKRKYPYPFNGEKLEGCCNGLLKNHGLYTQCEKKKEKESEYCKVCKEEKYGNITSRISVGLYEFKDPKGKSPKRYVEVLKKLKINKEDVEEEAKMLNITINPVHFEEENVVKRGRPKSEKSEKSEVEKGGKKGRPKKEEKTVEVNKDSEEEEDLFATLIEKAQKREKDEKKDEKDEKNMNEVEVSSSLSCSSDENMSEKAGKEEEKQKKAEEKAAKEAAKEKKAEEKAAKEAEKQKKAEEKAAKEAAKQKKAEEKAAKAGKTKKSKDLAAPLSKVELKDLAAPLSKVESKVEEETDVVNKFEFQGKSYYKSKSTGVIYNMEQEVVGKWNPEKNDIDFEDDEEEEEEYDE